jgi:radical SAM superfamily enzyme YgiQ (UPF0313 family)
MALRFSVIDSNYTDEGHSGMAATWLRWELEQAGITEAKPEESDVILMSTSSQQGVARVRAEVRAAKRQNRAVKVVLGGGGCYAPAVFDPYVDMACVGEGPRLLRILLRDGWKAAAALPEAWIPGEARDVIPCREFPWELPPLNHPDGTVRVFGSRGCRYSCLFCQTGWESSYRPNPNPERLQRQAKAITQSGKRLAIVTNDAAEEHVGMMGQQEFISVTLHNTMKRLGNITREQTKGVRFGVEGVSERLRRAVGKPIPSEDLIRTSADLLANRVGVRWFFVVGLPGESAQDWMEFRNTVQELKRHISKGVVMMNFHAYIPQPATPLCVIPLRDEYWERFDDFRTWFFHGPGFSRHVQLVSPARYPGRLQRALESMAATESELRRGWFEHDNLNWRVRYNRTPSELRRLARIYAKRTMTGQTPARVGDEARAAHLQ